MQRGDRDRFAEAEARELPDVGFAALIVDLVHRDDHRVGAALQQLRDAGVLLGRSGDDVDDEDDDVGRPHRGVGLRADLGRERGFVAREARIARCEPPAGVDDLEAPSLPLGRELLPVARHAGLFLDDGVALPDDAVDERRLPDVRPPDDGDDRELGGHERSAATSDAPSVATISTGCGRSSTVVPSRKRPRESATSGKR